MQRYCSPVWSGSDQLLHLSHWEGGAASIDSHIRSFPILFIGIDLLVRVEDDLIALEVTDDVMRVVSDHEIGEFLRAHLPYQEGAVCTCRVRKVTRLNSCPAPTRLPN